jgi:hypothetical protein
MAEQKRLETPPPPFFLTLGPASKLFFRRRAEAADIQRKRRRAEKTRERPGEREALNRPSVLLKAAEDESRRLFHDKRRDALFREYQNERRADPNTHSAHNGLFAEVT